MKTETRTVAQTCLVWFYNLGLLLCVVGTASLITWWWPTLQFLPSNDWLSKSSPFTGGYLLVCCWGAVWLPLLRPTGYDAFRQSKWRIVAKWARRMSRRKPDDDAPPAAMLVFLGPFVLWCAIGYTVSFSAPMIMAHIQRKPVTFVYTAEAYIDLRRRPARISLDVDNFWVDGLLRPRSEIAKSVQRGDTIVLSDSGNRWGVFYDKIELIKKE